MKQFGIFILGIMLASLCFAQTATVYTPRIKTTFQISESGDTSDLTEYFYDTQKRCTKVIMHDSYFGYTEKITYPSATSVVSEIIYSRDNQTIKKIYTLNARGQAISYLQVEKADTIRDRYLYNAAGFSMELADAGWMNATDAELKNGNFNLSSKLIVSNGNVTKNARDYKYTYYSDKKNTIGNKNFGIAYLGNDNKNPVKTETVPVMDTDITYSHSYLFDAKGRIIRQKQNETITHYIYTD